MRKSLAGSGLLWMMAAGFAIAAFPMPSGGLSVCGSPAFDAAPGRLDDPHDVDALVKMGVPLQRDSRGRVRWIEAAYGELGDPAMSHLPGLPFLEWLEIGGGKATGSGLSSLKNCLQLKRLYIHDVQLGDEALAFLSRLSRLEALSLQHTGISGKSLQYLKPGSTLKVLNLSGNNIVDDDLAQIARFSSLEVLGLKSTGITGAGLARLEGMARLNVLNLSNCRVEDADLQHFTTMPNLRIVYASGCNLSEGAIKSLSQISPMLAIFP